MRPYPTYRPLQTQKLQPVSAFVVFSDDTNLFWLRFLQKGFRHCALIIAKEGGSWVVVDPLSHHLVIDEVAAPSGHDDLPAQLRKNGHTLVAVTLTEPPRKLAPLMPFTCVEIIKRLVGIHSWKIVTPYQLYRHLTKTKGA